MTTTYTPPPAPAPAGPVAPGTQPPRSSGCLKYALIGCGIIVILIGIFVAVVVAFVFGAIKRTDVYKGALHRVQQDQRVVAVLGSPVEPGFIVTGSVNVNNERGTANFNFPVSGPKGKADVHATATLDENGWHYTNLQVLPNNGANIDVLKATGPADF